MFSRRAWRIVSPFLIPAAAFIAASLTQTLITLLINPIDLWLIPHESIGTAIALATFASFGVSSALGVFATSRFLLAREAAVASLTVHLQHCAVLYLTLIAAVIEHIRCIGYCEGLVLGAIKFFGLLAFGGTLGDIAALRRLRLSPAAA
jgi:hypothetical protein